MRKKNSSSDPSSPPSSFSAIPRPAMAQLPRFAAIPSLSHDLSSPCPGVPRGAPAVARRSSLSSAILPHPRRRERDGEEDTYSDRSRRPFSRRAIVGERGDGGRELRRALLSLAVAGAFLPPGCVFSSFFGPTTIGAPLFFSFFVVRSRWVPARNAHPPPVVVGVSRGTAPCL